MAQPGTTSLDALPVPGTGSPGSTPVSLQATEKNVVVANMAAELAAKRGEGPGPGPGEPTAGVALAGGPPPTLPAEGTVAPVAPPPPEQQANYARGVAAAAASGALALPQRDVIAQPAGVTVDPAARPLHVPQPPGHDQDYIARMERAHQERAEAARRAAAAAAPRNEKVETMGDPSVQAAAIATVLFLITQLPATRSFALSLAPKLFSGQSGGLKPSGAIITSALFGLGFYAATMATNYLSV